MANGIQVVENADLEQAMRDGRRQPLPAAMPVLPLQDMVAYPDTLTPLAVGRERSMKLVNDGSRLPYSLFHRTNRNRGAYRKAQTAAYGAALGAPSAFA